MSKSVALIAVSLILLLPVLPDAVAATYKCIDENGDVTYSQTPCRKHQKTDKLLNSGKKPVEMEDCKYAGAFSQMTFRQMRSGLSTQDLFDRYGGVSSISQATLGVINYVYSFKYSETMQPDRIAKLTIAKCRARAFGSVLCEDFPDEFQEMIFSCDDQQRDEAMRLQKLIDQSMGQQPQFNNSSGIGAYGSEADEARNQERKKAQEKDRKKREQARIAKCKKRYESQIERIENQMSRGYTPSVGDSLRERRREQERKLASECK